MNFLITSIIISLPLALVTAFIASHRHRNGWAWFGIALFFGIFGLALLLALPCGKKAFLAHKAIAPLAKAASEDRLHFAAPDLPARGFYPEPAIPLVYMNGWHYIDMNGEMKGPISFYAIRELWYAGIVTKQTFIWNHTETDWVQLIERSEYCSWLSQKEASGEQE